ncbi:MAG: hypothetical protein M1838_003839 [Thelocarpon superellum]|nr:MAG: hypothetical protein M1838_003839 [Thelocarpon superellum]
MFWRFGGYANISTLDTILDKPDVTLEELLDESDLIQELKQHNTKLIEYLRDENVLRRLLEYVVAPRADEDADAEASSNPADSEPRGKAKESIFGEEEQDKLEKARLKYAYIACEVLASETWSITEALMENHEHLRRFWCFLQRPIPLDPLQAGYFTKVNETLLDKKTEEMLDFFKSLEGVVPDMLRHVDCPMVMDLLLKIISLEKAEGGQGIVDWLHEQDLIPILLSYLSAEHSSATQTSAGDFLKAIITISANASQNEQSCIGPNELTRQLVSEVCVRNLTSDMLRGGNPLTVGVGIVIEVIRKNNSDYDPDVSAGADTAPSSRDPIYLGTLLRIFAQHVPDFMTLILSPTYNVLNDDGTTTVKRRELKAAFGQTIEPLGFDRFKTCELMAELLHCSNMGLLNERGSERFVRERDQERERLKAEGAWPPVARDGRAGNETDDSSLYPRPATPSVLGSGSPEEIRKLEVANGGEEDGFEDVAASDLLNDEVKDDFDEKPELDNLPPEATPAAIPEPSSHDDFKPIEADDFVDEPLSSPRLVLHSNDQSTPTPTPFSSVPLSLGSLPAQSLLPTSPSLVRQIDELGLEREQETRTSSSPTPLLAEGEEAPGPPKSADKPAKHVPPSDGTGGAAAEGVGGDQLSPHPEDHPAPLFAARNDEKAVGSPAADVTGQESRAGDHDEKTKTAAVGGEKDSPSVIMAGEESGLEPHIEMDVDGSPVVGDFLKMMFVEHRVVPTILDFFFRFPWNNFLHNVVYDVVQQVFNGPMDRGFNRSLAIDLFETGKVTERIVEGQRRSDKAQAETNMRLGYMGHLTLIAEEVVKFTERHPPEFLSKSVLDDVMHNDWIEYVERTLAETRERDNAILGGVRPDLSVGPRQAVINSLNAAQGFGNGPSAALASAGLTGGGSGLDGFDLANGGTHGGGSFNLTSGSLLSGFGSSSDEEDEDMDEINDEVDESGERAAASSGAGTGTDHFMPFATSGHPGSPDSSTANQAATSSVDTENTPLMPPPPPPPPPPLNIPPSRARRQLAARLAMNKKKKEDEDRRRLEGKHPSRSGFGIGPGDGHEEGEELDEEAGVGTDDLWSVRGGSVRGGGVLQSPHSSDDDDDEFEDEELEHAAREDMERRISARRRSRASETPRTTAATTRSVLEVDDDSDEELGRINGEEAVTVPAARQEEEAKLTGVPLTLGEGAKGTTNHGPPLEGQAS